jgi:hypothetical protein
MKRCCPARVIVMLMSAACGRERTTACVASGELLFQYSESLIFLLTQHWLLPKSVISLI